MSYEHRAYDNAHGDPVIVLIATGTHDVSRLMQVLSTGNSEQVGLAQRLLRQVRRRNGGRAALQLLADHGGPDFTDREPVTWSGQSVEVERVVRDLAEDMHRRGLLTELSEKSCSRTTAALAAALGARSLDVLDRKIRAALGGGGR